MKRDGVPHNIRVGDTEAVIAGKSLRRVRPIDLERLRLALKGRQSTKVMQSRRNGMLHQRCTQAFVSASPARQSEKCAYNG